jgi:siroheme synthase
MGLGRAAAIAASLAARGWNRATPAAVIVGATTAGQQVWCGTLEDLAADRAGAEPGAGAGTIVVGDVVAVLQMAERDPSTRSGSSRASSRDEASAERRKQYVSGG